MPSFFPYFLGATIAFAGLMIFDSKHWLSSIIGYAITLALFGIVYLVVKGWPK